jgi:drug/metabolite transporter superfamily protein YnfA
VRVGGDDIWVIFDGVCNIFFCPMDAFAVAPGVLLIFLGAISNFIFGWMGALALALAFGRDVEFAFGGAFVVFFIFYFFVADIVVVFSNNLKLGGNCIIPSSCNSFK